MMWSMKTSAQGTGRAVLTRTSTLCCWRACWAPQHMRKLKRRLLYQAVKKFYRVAYGPAECQTYWVSDAESLPFRKHNLTEHLALNSRSPRIVVSTWHDEPDCANVAADDGTDQACAIMMTNQTNGMRFKNDDAQSVWTPRRWKKVFHNVDQWWYYDRTVTAEWLDFLANSTGVPAWSVFGLYELSDMSVYGMMMHWSAFYAHPGRTEVVNIRAEIRKVDPGAFSKCCSCSRPTATGLPPRCSTALELFQGCLTAIPLERRLEIVIERLSFFGFSNYNRFQNVPDVAYNTLTDAKHGLHWCYINCFKVDAMSKMLHLKHVDLQGNYQQRVVILGAGSLAASRAFREAEVAASLALVEPSPCLAAAADSLLDHKATAVQSSGQLDTGFAIPAAALDHPHSQETATCLLVCDRLSDDLLGERLVATMKAGMNVAKPNFEKVLCLPGRAELICAPLELRSGDCLGIDVGKVNALRFSGQAVEAPAPGARPWQCASCSWRNVPQIKNCELCRAQRQKRSVEAENFNARSSCVGWDGGPSTWTVNCNMKSALRAAFAVCVARSHPCGLQLVGLTQSWMIAAPGTDQASQDFLIVVCAFDFSDDAAFEELCMNSIGRVVGFMDQSFELPALWRTRMSSSEFEKVFQEQQRVVERTFETTITCDCRMNAIAVWWRLSGPDGLAVDTRPFAPTASRTAWGGSKHQAVFFLGYEIGLAAGEVVKFRLRSSDLHSRIHFEQLSPNLTERMGLVKFEVDITNMHILSELKSKLDLRTNRLLGPVAGTPLKRRDKLLRFGPFDVAPGTLSPELWQKVEERLVRHAERPKRGDEPVRCVFRHGIFEGTVRWPTPPLGEGAVVPRLPSYFHSYRDLAARPYQEAMARFLASATSGRRPRVLELNCGPVPLLSIAASQLGARAWAQEALPHLRDLALEAVREQGLEMVFDRRGLANYSFFGTPRTPDDAAVRVLKACPSTSLEVSSRDPKFLDCAGADLLLCRPDPSGPLALDYLEVMCHAQESRVAEARLIPDTLSIKVAAVAGLEFVDETLPPLGHGPTEAALADLQLLSDVEAALTIDLTRSMADQLPTARGVVTVTQAGRVSGLAYWHQPAVDGEELGRMGLTTGVVSMHVNTYVLCEKHVRMYREHTYIMGTPRKGTGWVGSYRATYFRESAGGKEIRTGGTQK
ncbi:GIP [Symbiodinium sp. CCMP2456]|nr:GIP [Symbiodinium sp. CCMP2456]